MRESANSSTLRRLSIAPVMGIIFIWQSLLSPLFGQRCRFEPSCSEYSKEALNKYGLLKGLWLSLRRILRCNALFPGGEDPLE